MFSKLDPLSRFLGKIKVVRRLAVVWAVWLITVVVLRTTDPSVLSDVNTAVSSIVIAVIGILSVVLNSLVKKDEE